MNGRAFARSLDFARRWRWMLIRLMDVLSNRLGKYKSLGETNRFFQAVQAKGYSLKDSGSCYEIIYLGDCYTVRKFSSDELAFLEVMVENVYGLVPDLCRIFQFNPVHIIDAGANVGYTAMYLARQFPNSDIVGLEPDPENFQALTSNLQQPGFSRIHPLHLGLGGQDGWLMPENPGSGPEWGRRFAFVKEHAPNTVPCSCIDSIMELFQWKHIDILKMDIEGGEDLVFSSGNLAFLQYTRLLVVEVHSPVTKKQISSFLHAANFSVILKNDLLFAIAKNLHANVPDRIYDPAI